MLCTECGAPIPRGDLSTHMERFCPNRKDAETIEATTSKTIASPESATSPNDSNSEFKTDTLKMSREPSSRQKLLCLDTTAAASTLLQTNLQGSASIKDLDIDKQLVSGNQSSEQYVCLSSENF